MVFINSQGINWTGLQFNTGSVGFTISDRPTSPALTHSLTHLRLFLTLQVSSWKVIFFHVICPPDHKLVAVALPCIRLHLPWRLLQSTGMCHWFYCGTSRTFFHVRSDSPPEIESWIASKQLEFNQKRTSKRGRDIWICVYRPIDYVKPVLRRGKWRENWLELDFTGIQMRKKASQQKLIYRWKRKVFATLIFAFCLGSFAFIQARYNGITASLESLKPRLDQKPQIAFLFIARNRLSLDFVWDAFFLVYTSPSLIRFRNYGLDFCLWGSDVKFIATENWRGKG